MGKSTIKVGEKYGFLKVIEKTNKKDKYGNIYWNCLCECGNYIITTSSRLKNGHTKSCGCYAIELSKQRMTEKSKEYLKMRKPKEIIKNETILINNHIVMICNNKQVLLDYDDYLLISNRRWFVTSNGYCCDSHGKTLHREIMKAKKGQIIDHINGNKLDNRKNNLRFVTKSQNGQNRKCKGITYDKQRKKWCVNIVVNKKKYYLGRYKTEEEALLVRKEAEIKYQGEYRYNGN